MRQALWQQTAHFALCDESVETHYDVNEPVYFSNCHADQPVWLQAMFKVRGVVRRKLIDKRNNQIAYELFMLRGLSQKIVYEHQLTMNPHAENHCPWGQFISGIRDGLMLQLKDDVEPEQLLNEVIEAMALDYEYYLKHKRPIHLLLKSTKSVVRVSYDGQASFKVFGKKADRRQAIAALGR